MSTYTQTLSYFFKLPWRIQWRTFLVQLPRFVPLSILHITSPKGPHPFIIGLPSRKQNIIPVYVFVPPAPVDLGDTEGDPNGEEEEWKVPVVLDFHGGGFIMGSPLEQAPYASMMSRELGAVVISVSYRIGPFHQFPAAIHDGEDVLSAILDTEGASRAGNILRTEIQRYFNLMRTAGDKARNAAPHLKKKKSIVLDPTRLSISGFSAGGNIALNMALSVRPCANLLMSPRTSTGRSRSILRSRSFARSASVTEAPQTPHVPNASTDLFSPLLPPLRAPTMLDDPAQPWPSLLPPPQAQPRLLPLLLFYPSLDARLLPHERPLKPLPNALKADDKKPQKPRMPGLFSIMGPTYLPKRLRSHPRASPGLADPDDIQKNAAIFLVLPEKDSLAVQSDVWVDQMNQRGWNGPARFGDGRAGDWDGHPHSSNNRPQAAEKAENGGLEIWHAPACRHGWTQFPEVALGKHEKHERDVVFARTLDFVKEAWKTQLAVPALGNRSQELRPLEMPG